MSDLLGHARTSHLSLVVICVAVLVALSADTTGGAARAYEQLIVAERLANAWDSGWLEREIESTIRSRPNAPKLLRSGEFVLHLSGKESWGANIDPVFQVASPWCLGRGSDVDDELLCIAPADLSTHVRMGIDASPEIFMPGTYRIQTLAEFARVWDLLGEAKEVRYVEVVKDGYFIRADVTKIDITMNPERSAFESTPGVLPRGVGEGALLNRASLLARIDDNPMHVGVLPPMVRRLVEHDAQSTHYYLLQSYSAHILWRVDAERIPKDLQRAWRFMLPSAPPAGKYAESFPDLADYTKRVNTLDFATLGHHLADEVARSRSDIDLGIAKLPGAALTTWGLLLVISAWIYVLFQIEAVRDENPSSTSWLLFSRHKVPFMFAVLSLTAVPAITVTVLVIRGINNSGHLWVAVAFVATACAAALVLFFMIRSVAATRGLRN
jgi:hypothetical protein